MRAAPPVALLAPPAGADDVEDDEEVVELDVPAAGAQVKGILLGERDCLVVKSLDDKVEAVSAGAKFKV